LRVTGLTRRLALSRSGREFGVVVVVQNSNLATKVVATLNWERLGITGAVDRGKVDFAAYELI
jgi:hypothetical protein